MKKLYIFLACLIAIRSYSQTDIVIGTGTTGNSTTTYPCPLQDYYEGSRMQYLFLASELTAAGMAAGNISAIKFEVSDTANTSGRPELVEGMKVSIDATTTSSLTNNSWEVANTLVYGPTDYKIDLGTNTINFAAPFFWNGSDNIVIEICNGDPNNSAYISYSNNPIINWTTNLSFNASHTYRGDNLGSLCGTTTTTNTGTQTTRPNFTFSWTPASTTGCYLPAGTAASNITATTADLSWSPPTVGSPASQYRWELRTTGAPGSGPSGLSQTNTTTTTSASLSGLTPITTYKFYIRSLCTGGDSSIWNAGITFTTGCAAIGGFNENFDAVTTPALPQCWSLILRGASLPTGAYVRTATGNAYSAPNSISMYNSTASASDDIILVSPQLNNINGGTYRLKFYARNTVATEDLEIGTLSDNTSTATFTVVSTVDIGTAYNKYIVNFPASTGTDQYIGIRRLNTTTANYVYIDNITWEPIPSCVEPENLTHGNIDTSSVQLSWTAPASTTPVRYHIYYNTTNVPPTSSTMAMDSVAAPATSYNLTNLASGTKYYVWVRSNCGGTDVSVWSIVDSFYTASSLYAWATLTGFNADVVAEGINSPANTTTNQVDNANYVFVAPDYQFDNTCALPTRSLPAGRQIYNNLIPGMYFQLAQYTGDNDLRLANTDVGTLTFTNALTAEQVYLLATSGSGASQISVVVNFTDATNQTFNNISISDWYGSTTNMVVGGVGRVSKTTTGCGSETSTASPKLYQVQLDIDPANYGKQISDVTITRIDGVSGFAGIPNIMGISVKKGLSIMPVTISSFKGYRAEKMNKLEWITRTETNNTGFEIQRSADGRSFSKIGFAETKAANGTSSNALSYQFTDSKPFAGTSYYRLKQIDKDGRSSLSQIVAVKGANATNLMISAMYPNPATDRLNVILNTPASDKVTLLVTDVAGKVVMQRQVELMSGDNQIALDLSKLTSGTYMVKAVCNNGCESAIKRLVKQ